MPHRRHWHSKRKFKDGEYQLLSSHREADFDRAWKEYCAELGSKVRHLKGEDGKYHIYEKVEN